MRVADFFFEPADPLQAILLIYERGTILTNGRQKLIKFAEPPANRPDFPVPADLLR